MIETLEYVLQTHVGISILGTGYHTQVKAEALTPSLPIFRFDSARLSN